MWDLIGDYKQERRSSTQIRRRVADGNKAREFDRLGLDFCDLGLGLTLASSLYSLWRLFGVFGPASILGVAFVVSERVHITFDLGFLSSGLPCIFFP